MEEKLSTNELKYWIAFNQLREFGPKRFTKLTNHFTSLHKAWEASPQELYASGIEQKIIAKLIQARPRINPDHELEKLIPHHIQAITIKDSNYPALLREIPNPPPVLYYKGILTAESDVHAIGVVGMRAMSAYGKRTTEDIVAGLCNNGHTIVSGLALGIDACAHHTCVQHNHRTIAVLANGLDRIYPAANQRLADMILETGGMICTEYPIGTPSFKSHFPHRNRIIAGLSRALVVIEAKQSSGSLITANYALEYNREICAIPGPIYAPGSSGPHMLIAQGARLATSAQDIISTVWSEHVIAPSMTHEIIPSSDEEAEILQQLDFTQKHINDIILKTRLDAKKIHSILVTMEIKGYIKDLGNGYYILQR